MLEVALKNNYCTLFKNPKPEVTLENNNFYDDY